MSEFRAVKTDATDSFFRAFRVDAGVTAEAYEVVALGDGVETADKLLELVLAGIKRATASLAQDYGAGSRPPPKVGDYAVLVDGRNKPRCVWRTTEIEVKPLDEIDDMFAFDEGEGDRTRESWLPDHRTYFGRRAAREGFLMHDRIETVFQRFTIVWPRLFADGPKDLRLS